MSITFRQCEAFRAVMLTGTTTEAARMLGVSQPGVSRLVSDLEAEIGYRLFGRVGRRVAPTPEAGLLIEEIRRALMGMGQIREAAREIGESRYRRLRIVPVPSASSTIAIDLISRFEQKFPGTSVTLEVKSTDSALEWVVSQQCDLGITTALMESPAIGSELLESHSSVCVLPAGHPLSARDRLTLGMLEDERFISYCSDSAFRHAIDAAFRKAGVKRKLTHEARTTEVVCSMVSVGLGVAIVGISEADARLTGKPIVVKPVDETPQVTLSLIWATHRPISAGAREFVEMARRGLADPVSNREPGLEPDRKCLD